MNFSHEEKTAEGWVPLNLNKRHPDQPIYGVFVADSLDDLIATWLRNGIQKLLKTLDDPNYRLRVVSDEEAAEIQAMSATS